MNSQTCEHCSFKNPVGALICRRCYRLLTKAGKLPGVYGKTTDRLGTGMLNADRVMESLEKQNQEKSDPSKPFNLVLRLEFVATEAELTKTFRGETMLIGREDNIRRIKPDIDLSPFGAHKRGISRAHALLRREDDQLLLQDLDSRNHTFINGKQLPPNVPQPLHHKDKMRLGVMLMQVFFE
jgi:hypothetical protein